MSHYDTVSTQPVTPLHPNTKIPQHTITKEDLISKARSSEDVVSGGGRRRQEGAVFALAGGVSFHAKVEAVTELPALWIVEPALVFGGGCEAHIRTVFLC